MNPDIASALSESTFLRGLAPQLLQRVMARAHIRNLAEGETLFLQGEPATSVYVVISGWVKLYRVAPSGTEAVVSILTRGRSFGEAVALREGASYPVSAEAITAATVLRLEGAELRRLMLGDPEFATAILSGTYVHLQGLIAQVEQLKARSGLQRVAEFLLDLAECGEGGCVVQLPYNKGQIAARLGMKPESLSRAFARLREHGVRLDGNLVNIADLGALAALAADDRGKPRMKDQVSAPC